MAFVGNFDTNNDYSDESFRILGFHFEYEESFRVYLALSWQSLNFKYSPLSPIMQDAQIIRIALPDELE